MVGIGGGLGPALAEEGDLPAAVGTEEVAHILHQTNDGDVHHFRHLDRLFYHHADQLLGRGHDDDAVQGDGLEDVQGYVAGAGRHIHKEIVYVPDDVRPELGDHAADHRAPPDHGVGLVIQQEVDADELDAGLRLNREHAALVGHGPAVDAEGLGDGGAGDVRVQDAHLMPGAAGQDRQLAGDHGFADAALAGYDAVDLAYAGGGVVGFQEGLGFGAFPAALAAGAAVVGAFCHSILLSRRGAPLFLFFPGFKIFFPLFHGLGIVDGPHGGEGAEQTALEKALAVVERAELLLGFLTGGLQAGGQLAAAFLQLGMDGLAGLGRHGFQLFGQLAVNGVEPGKASAQLDGAADGEDDVREIDGKKDQRQGNGGAGGQESGQPGGYGGIGEVAEEDAGQAEEGGVQQADPAIEMEFILGVVPPAHVEELFHGEAGDIFYQGGQDRAQEEGQKGILAAAVQAEKDNQRAVAVDGADGTVEEAPLFAELPLAGGAVDHFAAPAKDAVDYQQEEGIGEF